MARGRAQLQGFESACSHGPLENHDKVQLFKVVNQVHTVIAKMFRTDMGLLKAPPSTSSGEQSYTTNKSNTMCFRHFEKQVIRHYCKQIFMLTPQKTGETKG